MGALLSDIGDYLQGQSLGLTQATNLFLGWLPEFPNQPEAVVWIMESPGPSPMHEMGQALFDHEQPHIQVNVRGTEAEYDTPRQLIDDIYQSLVSMPPQTLGGTSYILVKALQTPAFLERDDSNRLIFVCNFEVWKGPS